MNKGLQIVLLGVLFLVSGAVGYILEDVLLEKEDAVDTAVQETVAEPVAPQDTVSTVPVIMQDGISAPKRAESGKYGFYGTVVLFCYCHLLFPFYGGLYEI